MNNGKSLREAFGDEIVSLAETHEDIYVIDCDIGKSCKTQEFTKRFPDRHINVGIAEQCGAGFAAGLASCGKVPFLCTYAVFGSMRMCEQIRQEICYTNMNVKIACSHGGLTPSNDGASHQGIEDMGIMRTIPNMTIIMGADYYATRALVRQSYLYEGPVYLRFTRDAVSFIYGPEDKFVIGKAHMIYEGRDIAIIANGDTVSIGKKAAEILKREGIGVRLLDMHTIKPLDREAVLSCVYDIGKIITIEDHNILNGLGSAVCEEVAEIGVGKVKRIGIQDRFGESAPYESLLAKNGITVENIIREAKKML